MEIGVILGDVHGSLSPRDHLDALLRQVATQVRRVMPDMAPTITVRLDPPELGALRITIQAQHGEVLARIESPHQAVCAALDQRLPELRQVLEDAGIRVSACQVSVNTQAGREGPPSQWQLPQQGRQGWAPAASPPATGPADEAIMPQVVSGRARHTCVLDLFA